MSTHFLHVEANNEEMDEIGEMSKWVKSNCALQNGASDGISV